MEEKEIVHFPGAFGRIPNFHGAEKAAANAIKLLVWKKSKVIKANPDSPQRPLREKALIEGKKLYMAVPRLRDGRCFLRLDPAELKGKFKEASTIKGAFAIGKKVHPSEMEKIDLMIAGSVVVNRKGERIGKGGGFSDLEYAILRTFGLVDETTPIITTVHPVQIVDFNLPMLPWDITVDYIITPQEIIKAKGKKKCPEGILWEYLEPEKIKQIPVLEKLKTMYRVQK